MQATIDCDPVLLTKDLTNSGLINKFLLNKIFSNPHLNISIASSKVLIPPP